MPTPEGKLKIEVGEWLKASGLLWFRMQSGIVRVRRGFLHLNPEGTADYLIFNGPTPIWIELKAPGQGTAKARKATQAAFAERVKALGHRHAQCETLEQVIAAVREG